MTKRGFELNQSTERMGDSRARPEGQRLIAVWGSQSLVKELPQKGRVVIGRAQDVDVAIDHPSVSRRHAAMVMGSPMNVVEDLGSANGTRVNGRRLASGQSVPVLPGALLEIGSVLVLVQPSGEPDEAPPDRDVVVCDPTMTRLYELVDVIANSALSVIVLGETGAGKEVVAARVHARSARKDGPYVRINCAAVPEPLLESELFGYERGAFTGANAAKPGLLEAADGGTLFLDEIGELPMATQAKLLRVLESGEVARLGSVKPRAIDVRIVVATNRDLRQAVTAGTFRQDLYFRLDGVSVHVPPLRERRAEIEPLAQLFAAQASVRHGRPPVRLSEAAIRRLAEYPWPGNVRELRNVVQRSVVLAKAGILDEGDLRFESLGTPGPSVPPPPMGAPAPAAPTLPPPPPETDPFFLERQEVTRALEQCAGNQTRAAKLLGISRRTLLHKLDRLGLPRPRR